MSDSKPPPSAPVRPFSLRAEDFLDGAPEKLKEEAKRESSPAVEGADGEAAAAMETPPPPSYRGPDVAPGSAAGRASTQSRRPVPPLPERKAPKEEHTILMAVPPPAQENDGKS